MRAHRPLELAHRGGRTVGAEDHAAERVHREVRELDDEQPAGRRDDRHGALARHPGRSKPTGTPERRATTADSTPLRKGIAPLNAITHARSGPAEDEREHQRQVEADRRDLGEAAAHEQPLRTQGVEIHRGRDADRRHEPEPGPAQTRVPAELAVQDERADGERGKRDQHAGNDPDDEVERRRGAEHQRRARPGPELRPSPAPPSSPRCCEARAGSPPARPRARRHRARPPTGGAPARSRSRAGRRARSPGRSVARAPRKRAGEPRRAPAHPRRDCATPGSGTG